MVSRFLLGCWPDSDGIEESEQQLGRHQKSLDCKLVNVYKFLHRAHSFKSNFTLRNTGKMRQVWHLNCVRLKQKAIFLEHKLKILSVVIIEYLMCRALYQNLNKTGQVKRRTDFPGASRGGERGSSKHWSFGTSWIWIWRRSGAQGGGWGTSPGETRGGGIFSCNDFS